MHIPAGAFNQASNNDPVLEFNCTFRYDAKQLAVTDTDPPVGGTFTHRHQAAIQYDVNWNEPVDPASVQTTDLHLSGVPGTTVTNVQVHQRKHDRGVHDSHQQYLLRHVNGEHRGRVDHLIDWQW